MRDREVGAERGRQAVHGTEAGLREADAGDERRVGKSAAAGGGPVVPRPGREEALREGLQAGPGKRVRQHVCLRRGIGLQQLRERVHAIGGDDLLRAARQQVRIDDGGTRDQGLVTEGFLEAVAADAAQHRVLGRLAAGSGGGRNGDQGERRSRIRALGADTFQVLQYRVPVRQQPRDRLGGIECAAATDADDDSDPLAAETINCGIDGFGGRLPRDRQVLPGDAGPGEAFEERLPVWPGAERSLAGDDQRPGAERQRLGWHLRDAAGAEEDPRQSRGDKRSDRDHDRGAAGNRPIYGTPTRGSAIMSATVSRQVR